jgi:predicted GNAT family acetyltransferase
VEKAVEYLLKHPQYGQYFLAVFQHQPEQICGSLLTTYENKESYWMQSVYVKEEHRRKGIFTTLFKTVTKRCADNGVKSLQLYTEKENHKAKSTYQSLGMYCNGN